MTARYDTIGVSYADLRRPDPRIAAAIQDALGPADTVLNVGAGTGSYEPIGRRVTAVEPSTAMTRQRGPSSAKVVQASAGHLPFDNGVFDASMAVLTVHHWPDKAAGLREVRRVTRGPVVLLTFDPSCRPWLTDYLPELATLDETRFPVISDYARWLGGSVQIESLPLPHDCSDGFLYAYWRRPAAYLDGHIRTGSSSFWDIDAKEVLGKLKRDLEAGEWEHRYAELLGLDAYDAGYRLVIAN